MRHESDGQLHRDPDDVTFLRSLCPHVGQCTQGYEKHAAAGCTSARASDPMSSPTARRLRVLATISCGAGVRASMRVVALAVVELAVIGGGLLYSRIDEP
jgi:hypothetical protein